MYRASETHSLLPEGAPGGDGKQDRPHVLLRDCETDDPAANLAYASSQGNEAARTPAPACVLVDRDDVGYQGTGLSWKTWVYLSRLVITDPADLRPPRGMLRDEWTGIRRRLFDSFGIGSGTARSGKAAGSWRGCVVRLAPAIRDDLQGAEYAVVMTEPGYSRRRGYQHLVPIYHGPDAFGEEGDLRAEASWIAEIAPGTSAAFLAVSSVFSGCETGRPRTPGHFVQLTGTVVDRVTMEGLDAAVVHWFSLEDLM